MASLPVAHMFSRRVTGLYGILSASESMRPEIPLPMVPSQYASTCSGSMPADWYASLAASTSRSSAPLSQCSPKGVQPMPTIATRSLMPLLSTAGSSLGGMRRLAGRMPPAASEAAAVERHHLEGRRLDTFQAPDVHGRRRRTRFVAADGERRAAACRAEVMSYLVAPEGVAGEIG